MCHEGNGWRTLPHALLKWGSYAELDLSRLISARRQICNIHSCAKMAPVSRVAAVKTVSKLIWVNYNWPKYCKICVYEKQHHRMHMYPKLIQNCHYNWDSAEPYLQLDSESKSPKNASPLRSHRTCIAHQTVNASHLRWVGAAGVHEKSKGTNAFSHRNWPRVLRVLILGDFESPNLGHSDSFLPKTWMT